MTPSRAITCLVCLAACDRSASPDRTADPPSPPAASTAPTTTTPPPPRLSRIDPPAAPGARSPNLVVRDDRALLSWLEPTPDAPGAHRLQLAELVDGAWTPPRTVAAGPAIVANAVDIPSALRHDARTLVAQWVERTAGGGEATAVILARSTDDGQTWRRLGAAHRDSSATEHAFGALVSDGDSVHAFWLDGRATLHDGPTALRTARIGAEIGPEHVVDDRVCDCCSTTAAATTDGPIVVYRDRSADELRDPSLVQRRGDGWTAPRPVHADGWKIAGCPVNGPASAARDRDVAVAWYTVTDERPSVRVALSRDAGGRLAPPITVDEPPGARAPLGRVDVVLATGDQAVVSWIAIERGRGQLFARRIGRDGTRGAALAVATIASAREAGLPRLDRLGDDLLLAWTDATEPRLRVARLALRELPALAASPGR